MNEKKKCNKCKKNRLLKFFSKGASYKDGLQYTCKDCAKIGKEVYRDKYRENGKANEWALQSNLNRGKYNITYEEYEQMLKNQNGLCKICKQTCPKGRLCVDHCHTTGKVRGLLCRGCNTALGWFKDDIIRLEAAIIYLKENND